MIKILEKDHLFLIYFVVFGLVGLINNPIVSGIFGFALIIIGAIDVIRNENKSGEAHLYMLILGVFELYIRMNASIAPHEISKYSIIFFSCLGLFFSRNRRQPNSLGFIFIILFLPSLVVVDTSYKLWSRGIFFNLLGPIGLGTLLIYFYNYQINSIDIRNICRAIVLPSSSAITFIQTNSISIQDIEEVNFTVSNAELSGNFGGNQVSVMMGIIAGILLYCIFFNIKIFKYKILDYSLLGICIFRGLLTFSRGGITVPFVAFALVTIISFIRIRNLKAFRKGFAVIFGALFFYLFFLLVNSLTGSALERRYAGETGVTEKTGERDYLSGRDQIFIIDLEIFADHFLIGTGPGMARPLRYYYGFSNSVSAHIEFTRVLAEHGLLGLFALLIYIYLIFSKRHEWKQSPNETFFIFFTWWTSFLNSNHNAFRLGLTVFFLGFIVSKVKINPKYFTKDTRKKLPQDWANYLEERARALDPNNAESDPSKKLEQMATLPR